MLIPSFSVLGSGPTVLMLHGIDGGHLAFAPQVESFASAGYRAAAWDMPGYGRSAPIEPYTFKGLAASCIALIEALLGPEPRGAGGLTLVGHHIGGMVAQEVVARRPDLVERLVLSGTAPAFGDPGGEWQRHYLAQRLECLEAGASMEQLAQALVPGMIGPGALPEGIRLATHCMAQVPSATYRRALAAIVDFDRRADQSRIAVPTLLIAGEHDRTAPPASVRRMSAAIPRSTFVEMAGVGHLQNLEAPDEFDALVLNFLGLPRHLLH